MAICETFQIGNTSCGGTNNNNNGIWLCWWNPTKILQINGLVAGYLSKKVLKPGALKLIEAQEEPISITMSDIETVNSDSPLIPET